MLHYVYATYNFGLLVPRLPHFCYVHPVDICLRYQYFVIHVHRFDQFTFGIDQKKTRNHNRVLLQRYRNATNAKKVLTICVRQYYKPNSTNIFYFVQFIFNLLYNNKS